MICSFLSLKYYETGCFEFQANKIVFSNERENVSCTCKSTCKDFNFYNLQFMGRYSFYF